jgi:hypothetical protein
MNVWVAPEMIEFRRPGFDYRVSANDQYRDFVVRLRVAVQLIGERPLETLPGDLIMIRRDSDKDRLIESDRRLPQGEANNSERHEKEQYGAD